MLIYSQTSSLFVSLLGCGLALVAGHLIPLHWVLLSVLIYCYAGSSCLDVELRLQQPSRTSGVYSTERAMKHSYFLTHLRSYLDCIASIFINCSSIAGQETLIWHENVRFQCPCGTVFVILVLNIFAIITCKFCRSPWMICVLLASLICPTLDRLHFLHGTLKFD